jgi:hypothetical protein
MHSNTNAVIAQSCRGSALRLLHNAKVITEKLMAALTADGG